WAAATAGISRTASSASAATNISIFFISVCSPQSDLFDSLGLPVSSSRAHPAAPPLSGTAALSPT
ncbi:MAG TPA: hypothetical protein VIK32_17945, partial [Candidatus Limnocylindrales bacterium]